MYQVIIVEDDPMVAEIDKQYVEHNSKMAIAGIFQNGQDALDFVRTHPVDLIMLDYYMPVMDGRHLSLVKLRAEGILADVIMVTAASEAGTSASCTPTACRTTSSSLLTTTASKPPCRSSWPGREAFSGDKAFNQEELDKVIAPEGQRGGPVCGQGYPPGHLGDHLLLPAGAQERKLSIEDIAKNVSLSRVTLRRYMNYLIDKNSVIGGVDYSTGGRPSAVYTYIGK